MTNPSVHEDTQTVAYTTSELRDAIHDLIGMRTGSIDTDTGRRMGVRDSRYTEICADIQGQQGTQLGGVAKSMPPLWVDAVDWLNTVDTTVADWVPDRGRATTPDRLHTLADQTWRPQDVEMVTRYTETLVRWTAKADVLLEPPQHQWELAAPCPACNTSTVHRPDSAGDWIRQAALTVTSQGCICLNCDTRWAPDYYRLLAAAIGCELPDGVLE